MPNYFCWRHNLKEALAALTLISTMYSARWMRLRDELDSRVRTFRLEYRYLLDFCVPIS